MRAGRPLALAALVDGRGAPERVDGARGLMTGAVECRYHGRDFTPGEMALLRALIAGPPALLCEDGTAMPCRRSSAGASAGSSPTAGSTDDCR